MTLKPVGEPTQAELGPAGRNVHGQPSLASEKGGVFEEHPLSRRLGCCVKAEMTAVDGHCREG